MSSSSEPSRAGRMYCVRWPTAEGRAEMERLADRAGVSLAVALREGAREWLLDRQPEHRAESLIARAGDLVREALDADSNPFGAAMIAHLLADQDLMRLSLARRVVGSDP